MMEKYYLEVLGRREELVARIPALINAVPTVRFDPTGLFDNKLFVAISAGPVGGRTTRIVIVEPNGEFRTAINIYVEGTTPAAIEFSSQPSYPAGAYLYYADRTGFYRLDESFNLHRIASHTLPSGRSDIDPIDLKFDPTGKYSGLLTLSDTDLNNDELRACTNSKPTENGKHWCRRPLSVSVNFRESHFLMLGRLAALSMWQTP